MSRKLDADETLPGRFLYEVAGDPKVYEGRILAWSPSGQFVLMGVDAWRYAARVFILEELPEPLAASGWAVVELPPATSPVLSSSGPPPEAPEPKPRKLSKRLDGL